MPNHASRTPGVRSLPLQAIACGLHQLPAYERMKDKGLRGVSGMDKLLTYIEASDETIWPTERIKNGVISFTNGKLAGSVMKMMHGGQPVLVIVFGSPIDEGSTAAIADALRPRHTGKHPSVEGSVIEHVAQQWGQMDQGLLDLVRRLRDGPEKFGCAAAPQPHQRRRLTRPSLPLPPSPSLPPSLSLSLVLIPSPRCQAQAYLRRGAWAGRIARGDGSGHAQDRRPALRERADRLHVWRADVLRRQVHRHVRRAAQAHVARLHRGRRGAVDDARAARRPPARRARPRLPRRQVGAPQPEGAVDLPRLARGPHADGPRGESAQLGGGWTSAHTARAYCEALQKVCAVHGQDSAEMSHLLAAL